MGIGADELNEKMGADAPIPPDTMNAAAPDGAPPRRPQIRFSFCDYGNLPLNAYRGPGEGSIINGQPFFKNFL